MTLDEELQKEKPPAFVEAKTKPTKTAKQISDQLKKRPHRISDNLFGSDAGDHEVTVAAKKRSKKH
jgi:hypothetical protein